MLLHLMPGYKQCVQRWNRKSFGGYISRNDQTLTECLPTNMKIPANISLNNEALKIVICSSCIWMLHHSLHLIYMHSCFINFDVDTNSDWPCSVYFTISQCPVRIAQIMKELVEHHSQDRTVNDNVDAPIDPKHRRQDYLQFKFLLNTLC